MNAGNKAVTIFFFRVSSLGDLKMRIVFFFSKVPKCFTIFAEKKNIVQISLILADHFGRTLVYTGTPLSLVDISRD